MSLTSLISEPRRLLVEAGPRVLLWQHALQRGVIRLDGDHRPVDRLADSGAAALVSGCATSVRPVGPRRCAPRGTRRGPPGRRPRHAPPRASRAAPRRRRRWISPRTMCLYSPASMLWRSASAICHSFASKSEPSVAPPLAFACLLSATRASDSRAWRTSMRRPRLAIVTRPPS